MGRANFRWAVLSGLSLTCAALGCSSDDSDASKLGGDQLVDDGEGNGESGGDGVTSTDSGEGSGSAAGGADGDGTSGGVGAGPSASGGADGTGGDGIATGGTSDTGGQDGTGGGVIEPPMCDNSYPAFSCDMLGTWDQEQVNEEDALLVIVNQHRATGYNCGGQAMPAVDPLVMDETLRCAARVHSQDMANRGYFSHRTWNEDACECAMDDDCPTGFGCDNESGESVPMRCGKSPGTRVADIGGPSGAGWENIAAGNASAEDTMVQWMNSPGHCRNIMNGSLKTIGVGFAKGGPYGSYWTQSFDN